MKKMLHRIALGAVLSLFITMPVHAADASVALGSLNTFRDFLGQLISLIGTFYLLWGIFEFANSLMGNDGIMQVHLKKLLPDFYACRHRRSIHS